VLGLIALDSLAPARSPATLASLTVYVGGAVPPPFPPRLFYRAAKLGIRGEKAPVTQAKRLRFAADTALISAL